MRWRGNEEKEGVAYLRQKGQGIEGAGEFAVFGKGVGYAIYA